MDKVNFFSVNVKLQMETDATDRAGNPKIKKWNEQYIVRAENSQEADKIVREELEGCDSEWMIDTIKATKYIAVLNY